MNRHAIATVLIALAASAQAGTPDIGDEINARLARAKSQQAADAASRAGALLSAGGGSVAVLGSGSGPAAAGLPGNGCNIAIGNVFEDRRAGISTSAKRETTVIVTGDVIQVGNNCR